MEHVHLIGIGGSGLSAIALVLLQKGYQVSGSDRQEAPILQQLGSAGARVSCGHHANNVVGADLVIRSSAIGDDNVEVQAALKAGIPVVKRADFLGKLMAGQKGIAVAGTHGKTTTTAMIAWMLTALKQDPSYIIGGISRNLANNAHFGQGSFFVIEADEYDRMFLGLRPHIAVITNIEHDHPDCYPTYDDFQQAFLDFVGCLEDGGILITCVDDPGVNHLIRQLDGGSIRIFTYSLSAGDNEENMRPDYQVVHMKLLADGSSSFDVYRRDNSLLTSVVLAVPGEHNVRNAQAALVVADVLGLSVEEAAQALGEYKGTNRRFEVIGKAEGVIIVDDYAHHPTEIAATLAAARAQFSRSRLWVVWQPHTYSRTRTLFDGYIRALRNAEHLIVTAIFAAREDPPADGFSSRLIVDALNAAHEFSGTEAMYIPDLATTRDYLLEELQSGDVLLVLSAGDANRICVELLESLSARTSAKIL